MGYHEDILRNQLLGELGVLGGLGAAHNPMSGTVDMNALYRSMMASEDSKKEPKFKGETYDAEFSVGDNNSREFYKLENKG